MVFIVVVKKRYAIQTFFSTMETFVSTIEIFISATTYTVIPYSGWLFGEAV